MKTGTYYLHVSYEGIADNGDTVFGDMLVRNYKGSLNKIRELIKNDSKLKELPVITRYNELIRTF